MVLDSEPVRERINGRVIIYWLCECSCEDKTRKLVRAGDLKGNQTTSCGCFQKEKAAQTQRKYNRYEYRNGYYIGYDANNDKFYFDVEDFDKIKNIYWFIDEYAGGYAYYWDSQDKTKKPLHGFLMQPPEGKIVDHINRKPYDNRRSNLRICTPKINSRNISLHKNNTSGVSGVSWDKYANKWRARINDGHNRRINLGLYENFDEAVKVRREYEKKLDYISANKYGK